MGFKKISDNGIKFITDVCKSYDNIFTYKSNFDLPKSNSNLREFNAIIFDDENTIDTTDKYIQYLIKYINKYSEIFLLDANIVAAQIFVETKYSPLNFKKNYTFGLCGLIDYELVKYILEPNDTLTNNDVSKFLFNITGSSSQFKTFIPNLNITDEDNDENLNKETSNDIDNELARNNRIQLYRNIVNNPHLSIYVQCILLSLYASKNKNLASSTLLNYYLRSTQSSVSYLELINKNKRIYGNIDLGLKYVDDIFRALSGKYPNQNNNFGKDYQNIDFNNVLQLDDRKINPRANETINSITKDILLAAFPRIPKKNIDIYLKTINENIEKFQMIK
jgi:hypothetical protein